MAANAAVKAGAEVAILSKPRKSRMNGAQYLHEPPIGMPNVTSSMFSVDYETWGTPESYRFKVYGRQWDGTVSPEDLAQSHFAWDIRAAYDWLWDMYGGVVTDWEATPATLKWAIEKNKPDLVVSTVPAPLLCAEGHQFSSAKIWSTDVCWLPADRDNVVVCNGESSPSWYRGSRIQGWENTEWPSNVKPPVTPLWEVVKPLKTNCDCFPDVIRGGRYGNWTKGVLSHEVQNTVYSMVHDKIREES
jgi:hypothetical protein